MTRSLAEFAVLSFDCYGTLIDWESGIWDALQPLLMENDCRAIRRGLALETFAQIESAQQASTPGMRYPQLLERVHAEFARQYGLRSAAGLDRAFGESLPHWPAFPDTADALRVLAEHYQLVILSNVDRDGFAASQRKLGVRFDAVYTAEDVGSYKPDPRNFAYLLEHVAADLGVTGAQILHTAQSLFHDHVPAAEAGLARAWIDRQGLAAGGEWGATARVSERPEVDFLYPTLGAMAEAVGARA